MSPSIIIVRHATEDNGYNIGKKIFSFLSYGCKEGSVFRPQNLYSQVLEVEGYNKLEFPKCACVFVSCEITSE